MREIFTKKCRQQQIFDSDLKGAWHYNHVTFTRIAKNFMLYCRLIYMLSILCVRLKIKVKVGMPESFKVGWYPPKITGSSHLNLQIMYMAEDRRRFREIRKRVPEEFSVATDIDNINYFLSFGLEDRGCRRFVFQTEISGKYFVLLFYFLVHRLAVRISLPFYI